MFLLLLACAPSATTLPTDDDAPEVVQAEGDFLEPAADPVAELNDGEDARPEDTSPDEDSAPPPAPGACTTFEEPVEAGHLPADLDEVSGLVASRTHPGVLWALEDSGNAAELYALDVDGSRLATIRLPVPNVDWEDLALAPCGDHDCLWIADVGDNNLVRTDAALYVIREPAIADAAVSLERTIPVRYADGPRNVEALVVNQQGEPTLFTKRDDGSTEVIQRVGTTFASIGELPVSMTGDDARASRVTAADLWPDDRTLLLRTYEHAFRYELTDAGVSSIFHVERQSLSAVVQEQVESVAWDPSLRGWWQTSEGVRIELYFTACAD